MTARHDRAPPVGTGRGAETEHGQALIGNRSARRRLPPYGRVLAAARRSGALRGYFGTSPNGRHPTLWLLVGTEAWSVAQRWADRLAVVAPHDADPADFDWSMLSGADPVLLIHCGAVRDDHLQRVVAACFRDGMRRVLDISTGIRYVTASPCREIANVV